LTIPVLGRMFALPMEYIYSESNVSKERIVKESLSEGTVVVKEYVIGLGSITEHSLHHHLAIDISKDNKWKETCLTPTLPTPSAP
jgi:hypothetical protein